MPAFVDTNVLLYATSTAANEAPKTSIARVLLSREDLVLSVQVLQEFYAQATRHSREDPLPHDTAVALIESGADAVNVALRAPWDEDALGSYLDEVMPAVRKAAT